MVVARWPSQITGFTDYISNADNYILSCRARYLKIPLAFDIEVTTLKDIKQGFMYIAQLGFSVKDAYVMRTWEEVMDCFNEISWSAPDDARIYCYVHNLSYEFQFMKSYFEFDDVFVIKNRRVLRCTWRNIVFCCSYMLSNFSLDGWCRKLGVSVAKQTGTLDYSKIRYPWTALNRKELRYAVYDVFATIACVLQESSNEGLPYWKLPSTSTGYVRRDFKKALGKKAIKRNQAAPLSYEEIVMLRKAFRGGDTHGNRYYAGDILENVRSVDKSSSYPSSMVYEKYPTGHFEKRPVEDYKICSAQGKPMLLTYAIAGAELADFGEGFPYIPVAKCDKLAKGYVADNGRILQADYLEITITDVEREIIHKQYAGRYEIKELWVCPTGYQFLPLPFRNLIKEYYTGKTTLKGIADKEVEYLKYKNRINSAYGMTVQNPVSPNFEFNSQTLLLEEVGDEYDCYKSFIASQYWIPYYIGVWCTAYARRSLYYARETIKCMGGTPVYCDTDSIKYISPESIAIKEYSIDNMHKAQDRKNKWHYMGEWEVEDTARQFRFWGAKKYAGVYEESGKDMLHITIAGVPKKEGAKELHVKGGIAAFKPGFIWEDSGKNALVYNDELTPWRYVTSEGTVEIRTNIAMVDCTYTLGITDAYLRAIQLGKNYAKKLWKQS